MTSSAASGELWCNVVQAFPGSLISSFTTAVTPLKMFQKAGVDDPERRYGMQGIWADYDNDGWPDLYVTNDAGPNFLYHNKHDGTFDEVGLPSGSALSLTGRSRARWD